MQRVPLLRSQNLDTKINDIGSLLANFIKLSHQIWFRDLVVDPRQMAQMPAA